MRDLAIRLLDDEHGISNFAWKVLRDLLIEAGDCEDIIDAVEMEKDDRIHLPESWGENNET